jgi:hypothetical protein
MPKSKGKSVSRIAILNSYLQGGHVDIAESESSRRFINAGKNLGIEVRVFAKSENIADFDPDFVVNITYQEGKLTKYPTYVSLNIAPSLVYEVPRFIRNILSCDGFLTISPSVVEWLTTLCAANNKVPNIGHAAFSVPRREFVSPDFENASVMYCGTNWDGLRHQNLFWQMTSGEFLKCYGPAKSWELYPATLYGGSIPFDGVSLFNAYHKHGIGLCIGYPAFDKEGIASSRIFEIAAAGALALCSNNSLIKSIYGDSVLYLEDDERSMAYQIMRAVDWVRANPQTAQTMARKANEIFNKELSMEVYINNMVALHEQVMNNKMFVTTTASASPNVTYCIIAQHLNEKLIFLLDDILSQSHENINIVVLSETSEQVMHEFVTHFGLNADKCKFIEYHGAKDNQAVIDTLQSLNIDWLGMLSLNDRIFPNHTSLLLEYGLNQSYDNTLVSAITAGSLDHSFTQVLPELMSSEYLIITQNKVRLGYVQFEPAHAVFASLMNFALNKQEIFNTVDFYLLDEVNLLQKLKQAGIVVLAPEVTCSTNIEDQLVTKQANHLAQSQAHVQSLQEELAVLKIKMNEIITSRTWKYANSVRNALKKVSS